MSEEFFSLLRRYPDANEKDMTIEEIKNTYEYKQIQSLDKLYLKYFNRHIDPSGLLAYLEVPIDEVENTIKNKHEPGKVNSQFSEYVKHSELFYTSKEFELPRTSKKAAVIVETRTNPLLEYSVKNALHYLKESWSLYIFHGYENEEYVKELSETIENINFINLCTDTLTINDYNNLLTKPLFWNAIDAEHVLIFQTDSIMFRSGIESYMPFDYIGAPWRDGRVGNGGFSLRKKSKMLNIIKEYSRPEWENEDEYFSRHCKNKPNCKMASSFCVEHVNNSNPLATHQGWCFHKNILTSRMALYDD